MKLHAAKAFILLFVLISQTTLAQTSYKTFTLPAEGNSSQVNCLYQLRNGYILVGSTAGAYKFDGTGFQKIQRDNGVPDNVTAICEAKDGKIWIGFGDGKLGWLKNNSIQLQNPEEGFPKKSIRKILQDKSGIIWIATAGEGIYYYRNGKFYNINTDDGLSDNYVYDIALYNTQLVAGTDRGINFCSVINDKKQITSITSATGTIPDNIIRCITAADNLLAFGMQDAGVGIRSEKASHILPNWNFGTANQLLPENELLWIASDEGLIKANTKNHLFINILKGKFTIVLKDIESNIWVAGNDKLVRINGNKLSPLLSISADEAANLHTLLIDRSEHVWYNVRSGLKHLSEQNGKWSEKIYPLPVAINSQITALYEDRFENIWIGTMGSGVFLLDPRTTKFRKITEAPVLKNASVLSITGKEDHVWIASLEGAARCNLTNSNSRIDQSLQIQTFTSISGIGTNYIYHIYTDSKNRTWFATDGKGLAVYEKDEIRIYNRKHGLKSEVIYQVTEDTKGDIWFITFNAGLVKFDGKHFTHYTTTEGLSSINITSIAADRSGNLYLGHAKGIDVFNTVNSTVNYIDEQQGISNLNTDLNTIVNKVGKVYFVADKSIYRFEPSVAHVQPKIIIDRIQLFLTDIDVEDGHPFKSDQDNISFYYTGLSYTQPDKIHYQYKLEGYGNEWITTNDRRRDFPKLAPGTYTFRVRVSLNKNFNNAPEASFTFTIEKPIWMQWWFIVGLSIFIGAILYLYIKDREKRLQKWERLEKEKIQSQFETLRNQVNPHFLFNSFNTLVSEIEEDPKRAVAYVEHMADFFRSIVTYREKDIITLKEEITIIKDYLFIQEKRYGCAFQVKISVTEQEQQQYLLAPLTLQLLAENAIKHNSILREKPLLLEVFVEANQLIVRNNLNPKFNPEKSSGLGLQNIRKRYELLTKKTVVISNNDEYYTVIIPLILKTDGKRIDN